MQLKANKKKLINRTLLMAGFILLIKIRETFLLSYIGSLRCLEHPLKYKQAHPNPNPPKFYGIPHF
jgi:hypothetical protein